MGNRTFNTGSLSSVITVDPITLNVGIGGAPTAYKANVTGAVAATNFVLSGATGNTGIYYGHTDRVVLANYTAGGIDFEVNGGSISMTLFPNGNLAVGTSPTDAGYKLDVIGTGRFTGLLVSNSTDTYPEFRTTPVDADVFLGFSNTGDGNNAWGIGRRNTGEFWITNFTGNFNSGTRTTVLSFASNGAATFSNSITATQGSFALPTVGGAIGSVKNLTVSNTNGAVGDWAGLNFAYYNTTTNFGYIGTVLTSTATNSAADLVFGVKTSTSATSVTEILRLVSGGYMVFAGSATTSLGRATIENDDTRFAFYSTQGGGTVKDILFQAGGSASAPNMTFKASGNLLIGTTIDNGYPLRVNGRIYANGIRSYGNIFGFFQNSPGTFEWEIGSDAAVGTGMYMYNASGGYAFKLTAAGTLSTPGGGTSDRRTKEYISPITENALSFINELNPVSFKFIDDKSGKTRRGFIAQEVLETSIPSLVLGDGEKEDGTYGLDYDGILALATKAIQELSKEVTELKAKLK